MRAYDKDDPNKKRSIPLLVNIYIIEIKLNENLHIFVDEADVVFLTNGQYYNCFYCVTESNHLNPKRHYLKICTEA